MNDLVKKIFFLVVLLFLLYIYIYIYISEVHYTRSMQQHIMVRNTIIDRQLHATKGYLTEGYPIHALHLIVQATHNVLIMSHESS